MFITQPIKRAVQIKGGVIATIDGERRHTWAHIAQRMARLAGALQGLGMEPGDRVAILALNGDRYFEYYYGVPWGGGVVVPLNIRLAPPELVYILNDSGSTILLVDETFREMAQKIRDELTTVKHVVYMSDGDPPQGMLGYEALLGDADPADDVMRGGEDLLGIFYTGGTTGLPKGVMLSHDNLMLNSLGAVVSLGLGGGHTYLHSAPMFHLADGSATFAVTMEGGTHVFIPAFDVEQVLNAVQEHRVTYCLLLPTMINLLVNFPGVETYDFSSVRHILYGASPMPLALLQATMELFPKVGFFHGYGMTETSPLLTGMPPYYHTTEGQKEGKLKSAGQAAVHVELRIVDENDREVPRGTPGEIVTRGPQVMMGYWNQPEWTAEAIRDGWMHTGDASRMDEDGFIYIEDRVKDMIISGAENIYSTEVENAVYQHPAVLECAVIGIPSEKWGEAVHAIIVPREGQTVTQEAIIELCHTLIAGYKCPKSVDFRAEALPVSGAGKILKHELRSPFWEGRERNVN